MAAVAVLPPSGTKTAAGAEEQMDVDVQTSTSAAAEEDLYTRLKTLQRQLEFLEIQVGSRLASRSHEGPCSCVSLVVRVQAGMTAVMLDAWGCMGWLVM